MDANSKRVAWCFTLNNYTDDDLNIIQNCPKNAIRYMVYGKEVSETGTPHLQGFILFQSKHRKRRAQVVSLLGGKVFVVASTDTNTHRPNFSRAINYCKKGKMSKEEWTEHHEEGPNFGVDYEGWEWGEKEEGNEARGKRNDIEAFKDDVKAGLRDVAELRERHSRCFANYKSFCLDYIRDKTPPPEDDDHPLRDWQQKLTDALDIKPDKRTIHFIIDLKGNSGKSWFSHWYERQHPKTTQCIVPGKKADMAMVLINEPRVLFFDAPRSKQGEFIQYDFLEECKNGYVFASKYESAIKKFNSPHVVVMMNEYPDATKLSVDRYRMWVLGDDRNGCNEVSELDIEVMRETQSANKENAQGEQGGPKKSRYN